MNALLTTHEERIALAQALTWDIANITPDEVRKIISRLEGLGFELRRSGGWRPISEADASVAYFHDLPGLRIGNSHPIWVRDEDGRVYEAVWSDDGKRAYWWDLEGESPVDPVEFMPHPLDPCFTASGQGPASSDPDMAGVRP